MGGACSLSIHDDSVHNPAPLIVINQERRKTMVDPTATGLEFGELTGTVLTHFLSNNALIELSAVCKEYIELSDGETVFPKSQSLCFADGFYIVKRGCVYQNFAAEIHSNFKPKQEPKEVKSELSISKNIFVGDWFGEEAVIGDPDGLHNYEARVVSSPDNSGAKLLVCSRAKFESLSKATIAELTVMFQRNFTERLAKLPFLKSFENSEFLKLLSAKARLVTGLEGDTLIANGIDNAGAFGELSLLLKGEATCVIQQCKHIGPNSSTNDSTQTEFDLDAKIDENVDANLTNFKISAGSFSGIADVLFGIQTQFKLIANTPCAMIKISKLDFQSAMVETGQKVDIQNAILQATLDRVADKLDTLNIPFFRDISKSVLNQLVTIGHVKEFESNELIWKMDHDPVFAVSLSGDIQIKSNPFEFKDTVVMDLFPSCLDCIDQTTENGSNYQAGTVLRCGDMFGAASGASFMRESNPHNSTVEVRAQTRTTMLLFGRKQLADVWRVSTTTAANIRMKLTDNLILHPPTLKTVLYHQPSAQHFATHLTEEYSIENFEFWKRVDEFEQSDCSDSAELSNEAQRIFDDYIAATAAKQVNLKSSMVTNIAQLLKDQRQKKIQTVDFKMIFSDAKFEVFRLMQHDSFERFKKSEHFEQMLQNVAIHRHELKSTKK